MSLESPRHPDEQEAKFTNYSDLLEVSKPKLETYIESAQAIGDSWTYARKQHSNPDKHVDLREVWGDLLNEYVVQEEDPKKRMLNSVMVEAPIQAARDEKYTEKFGKFNELVDRSSMSRADNELMKNLKRHAVEYNHRLRKVVMDGREMGMDRVELTRLMSHASGTENAHVQWARDRTAGVIAEVALYDGLQISTGVESPEFTTIERDLGGTDLDARVGRHKAGFDAKFDKPILDMQWGLDGDYDAMDVTIGVPVEAIADMGLSRWGADYFKNNVGPKLENFAKSKDR